jgi:hypothetical protein
MIETIQENNRLKEIAKVLVSKYYNVEISEPTRLREYVIARGMFYKLLRDNSNMTYQDIANTFKKNHATVLHSVKNIEGIMEYDYSLRCDYLSLNSAFNFSLNTVYEMSLEESQADKEHSEEYYWLLNDFNKLKKNHNTLLNINKELVESNDLLNKKYKNLLKKHEEREVYYRDNGFIIK